VDIRNEYSNLGRNHKVRRPLRELSRRWKDTIKKEHSVRDFIKITWVSIASNDCCEYGNELSNFLKGVKFVDQLTGH
jgi:hypothetical protein